MENSNASDPNTAKAPLDEAAAPGRTVYAALFLVTTATLLLELGLTRIFSVIMYYHMAFFAVSVTLFGLSFGAVLVHLLPRVFTPARASRWIGASASLFGATTVGAIVFLLSRQIRIDDNRLLVPQLAELSAALAVPFTFAGVAISLALTSHPRRTNLLYGFDLAGSALGCLLFAPLMTWLGGPIFIVAVASLGALAGTILGAAEWRRGGGRALAALSAALLLATLALAGGGARLTALQIRNARGYPFPPENLLYDGWNSISRVTVFIDKGAVPTGVSKPLAEKARLDQNFILIDTFAGTPIVPFDGKSFDKLYFPFHDVSYAAHAVKRNARVAVIGVGGGRDILAAKAWGQPEVVGVEINSRVLEALTKKFPDYAGRTLDWPGVRVVQDEARSYIARSPEKFDIIQASLIDTFAATSAGAFVLTESALYTLEGWRVFYDHLSDDGILSMTRWHSPDAPVEPMRLLGLARETLRGHAKRAQDHLLMALMSDPGKPPSQPLATLLMKKSPFTPDEVAAFEKWCGENYFTPIITPAKVTDPQLREILDTPDLDAFFAGFKFDIAPPTDDRPFFFDVLRWRDILKPEYREKSDYVYSINFKPLVMLGTLLATVMTLAAGFILLPLILQEALKRRRTGEDGSRAAAAGRLFYFVLLGLSYLMIELSLIQRFAVFLGHPSYSLTVCLFSMLLSSGLGSMAAQRIFRARTWSEAPRQIKSANLMVVLVLAATLVAARWIMVRFVADPTPIRIALAGAVLIPAGFLMGMPLPLGLQAAARRPGAPLSWYWGINGAFSVAASALAVALAHTIGLSGTYFCGTICYLLAGLLAPAFGPARAAKAESPTPAT